MILFWLLCVILLLGGLLIRVAALESRWRDLWLHLVGIRVVIPPARRTTTPERRPKLASQPAGWPPPRVVTRAGP
jgi:hypothetical protein